MLFGAALRMFRLEAGLSLRALARRVGVSSAYLSRVETGRDPSPTPVRLEAIAAALQLPPDLLVELAHQTGPALSSYLERVPAASAFFLDVARRDLDAAQLGRLRELIDGEFTAPESTSPASLSDLVGQRVVIRLACSGMKKVIDTGAARCVSGDRARARDIARRIRQRERECPTGLGNGFAVPHAIVPGAESSATLITLSQPLASDSPDGAPIEVAVVLVSSAGGPDHLETLARVARIASRGVASELRRADTPHKALSIIKRIESS